MYIYIYVNVYRYVYVHVSYDVSLNAPSTRLLPAACSISGDRGVLSSLVTEVSHPSRSVLYFW